MKGKQRRNIKYKENDYKRKKKVNKVLWNINKQSRKNTTNEIFRNGLLRFRLSRITTVRKKNKFNTKRTKTILPTKK